MTFPSCQGVKLWIDILKNRTYPQTIKKNESYPVFGYIKKHVGKHELQDSKSMISLEKVGLSTKSLFTLSTTTTLFYKKKIRRQDNPLRKNKNVVTCKGSFGRSDQVRFALFSCGLKPKFSPHAR
jgi:hypothetical protein